MHGSVRLVSLLRNNNMFLHPFRDNTILKDSPDDNTSRQRCKQIKIMLMFNGNAQHYANHIIILSGMSEHKEDERLGQALPSAITLLS